MPKITITYTIELEIDSEKSFLEHEENIQRKLNQAGCDLTAQALKNYDTDGSPIIVNNQRMTSKGLTFRHYQTMWGEISIVRHIYQTSKGGAPFCPVDATCKIINMATPYFARSIAWKYAQIGTRNVQYDLTHNHLRPVHIDIVQRLSALAAAEVQKDDACYTYAPQPAPEQVQTIALSLDGTCLLMIEGEERNWRQAMCGSITLYDPTGDRINSIYLGAAPQEGKSDFLIRLNLLWEQTRQSYPAAQSVGISDGARDFKPWLAARTGIQVLDFYHVSEYLSAISAEITACRGSWLEETLHQLKHEVGAAETILTELKELLDTRCYTSKSKEVVNKAIVYFESNLWRMNYAVYREQSIPIGSGVIEAACKSLVKTRMCGSSMKWKTPGANTVLSLRSLALSGDCWEYFWKQYGEYKTTYTMAPKKVRK